MEASDKLGIQPEEDVNQSKFEDEVSRLIEEARKAGVPEEDILSSLETLAFAFAEEHDL